MKIAHLISQYYPNIGGAEICVHNVCAELAAAGHEPVVVTTTPSPSGGTPPLPYPIERLHPRTNGLLRRIPFIGQAFLHHKLATLQNKYGFDLWQVTMGWPLGVAAVDFFQKRSIPSVLRCCGEDIQKFPEIGYGYRLDPKVDSKTSDKYPLFDAFVALTPAVEREYLDLGIPENKIDIIPNGADTAKFADTASSEELRAKFAAEGKTLILTTGRYHPKKGFDLIPEIAARLKAKGKNFIWVVAGPGTKRLLEKFPDAAASGVVCSEDFMKPNGVDAFSLPPPSLIELYKTADIYALPTLIETFGMVLVEAMAATLPIVTTTAPGVDDVVKHERTGLKTPTNDTTAFANAIIDLIDNDALRGKLADNALKEARSKYDWGVVTGKYLQLYETTIRQKKEAIQ